MMGLTAIGFYEFSLRSIVVVCVEPRLLRRLCGLVDDSFLFYTLLNGLLQLEWRSDHDLFSYRCFCPTGGLGRL